MIPVIWTDNFKPGNLQLFGRALMKKPRDLQIPTLPSIATLQQHVVIDEQHLSAYQHLVEQADSNLLPPLYLQVYSLPMQLFLLTHSRNSLGVMGLVHLANEVTQWRPLADHEDLQLVNLLQNLRPHKRGWMVDICTEAYSESQLVWRSVATSLYRCEHGQRGRWSGVKHKQTLTEMSSKTLSTALGRQYAAISGDYNPIHLTPLTARLFGFKRHIIHGLWSKGYCLSQILQRYEYPQFHCRVEFKRPAFLPNKVTLLAGEKQDIQMFSLTSEAGEHLLGEISEIVPDPVPTPSVNFAPGDWGSPGYSVSRDSLDD